MNNQQIAQSLITAAGIIGVLESEEWVVSIDYNGVTITRYFYDYNDNNPVEEMNTVRRTLGGKWDKVTTEYDFTLRKQMGDDVTLQLQTSRKAACTPRVVGTETVEVKDYSNVPTKTVERDVVEWDCNPILDA